VKRERLVGQGGELARQRVLFRLAEQIGGIAKAFRQRRRRAEQIRLRRSGANPAAAWRVHASVT